MARIERTEAAFFDLSSIWQYITDNNSPVIADAMLARISGALEILASAPLIGKRRTDLNGKPRAFAVKPYVIIYDTLADKNGILVWRVLHGARDIRRIVSRPGDRS